MKIEFQKDILKFLAQRKSAKTYLETIEADLFSDGYDYLAYCVIKAFFDKYNTQPTESECLEYFHMDSKAKQKDITPEMYTNIERALKEAYKPYAGKDDFVKDKLIEQYQIKLTKDLFREKASELKDADSGFISEIYREVNRINKLSDKGQEEQEENRGSFLLKDHIVGNYSVVEGTPTYLKGLNKMTAIGGFASPQLIVFMSGPKRFKTGTALNIALGLTRDGFNVYYADTENDQRAIEDRMKQAMLRCTHRELVNGEFNEVLEEQVKRYKVMGGDFKCDFFPAHTKTIQDVEAELEYLEEEFGWVADAVFYDNLDNFQASDKTIKDKRLQIQAVYFEAIRLQKRRKIFGITLSQIGRNAVNKRVIEMTDFAEDFGKAANCHAAFAICADEFEMQAKVRRIIPVVQRQGVDASSNAACYVRVDAGRQTMDEISYEEWKAAVEEVESKNPAPKKAPIKKARPDLKGALQDK